MSNLPVPRKPQPLRITNTPPGGVKGANTPASNNPNDLIRKLKALVEAGLIKREDVIRLIEGSEAAPDAAPASPALGGPIYEGVYNATPPRADTISVGGSIAPGAQVGGGQTTNRDVAGRDLIQTTVENGGVSIHIGTVEQFGTPAATNGDASNETALLSEVEREYLHRLLVTASRVPLGQLELEFAAPDGSIPEIRLDAIYVPLDITATQPAVGGSRADERVPVPVLDQVIRHRHLVILGDPGSGKSTLLNFLTWALAGARLYPKRGYAERLNIEAKDGQRAVKWRHGALLPIRLNLREVAAALPEGTSKGSADLLWKAIVRDLAEHHLEGFAPTMHQYLTQGQCLVMLDGMDEIPKDKRQIVKEAIGDFASTHDRNRFIVTCRILSYTDPAWKLGGFPDVSLAPLSKGGIQVFIEGWYSSLTRLGYMDARWNRAKADELRKAATSYLYDLGQNPMLLTVMAVVHTYKGTLPRERARLYSDCVDLLLWDWQRSKLVGGLWQPGILEQLETREERVMNALCDVAFRAHRAQGAWPEAATIPEAELMATLKTYLDNSYRKAELFCEYVEQQAGLLISRGDGKGETLFTFPHRGFQEFLAGRFLVSGRDFARQAARLAAEGDLWHEVLLLAAGHLVFNLQDVHRPLDAANLLSPSVLPDSDAGWRSAWWAGEMLLVVGRSVAEQDEFVGQGLVPRVIQSLTALVSGTALTPPERAQAADVLGLLGDPREGVCTPTPAVTRIEGGAFRMGGENDGFPMKVKAFWLGRYPVTNAQFREFVKEGYHDPSFWTPQGMEWRNHTAQRGGLVNAPEWGIDNRPVVGITWHEAVAYCRWLRKKTGKLFRLPTEAEWERAAGGLEGRKYPWGQRTSDDTTNARDAGIGQTCAVGIFHQDKTPEGVYDLGGNVWEWTSTLEKDYPYKADDGREKPDSEGKRILRGGSYDSKRDVLHCHQRRPVDPGSRATLIGFRVALDE